MILKRPTAKLKKKHNIALNKTQGFYFEAPGGEEEGGGGFHQLPTFFTSARSKYFSKINI